MNGRRKKKPTRAKKAKAAKKEKAAREEEKRIAGLVDREQLEPIIRRLGISSPLLREIRKVSQLPDDVLILCSIYAGLSTVSFIMPS